MAQQSGSLILDTLANGQTRIIDKAGNLVSKDRLTGDGKIIGLYVSAHWCPPCRGFTPKLAEFYESRPDKGDKFNIIFISCDRDQKSFKDYFGTMPWLAMDYDDKETMDVLKKALSVSGIPQLAVIDGSDGTLLQQNARNNVINNPGGFPWRQ